MVNNIGATKKYCYHCAGKGTWTKTYSFDSGYPNYTTAATTRIDTIVCQRCQGSGVEPGLFGKI